MTSVKQNILDWEVPVNVPASVDEYNALDTTRPNACLEDAIKYIILHSYNTDAREVIVGVVETLTGVKRKMKPGANKKDGTPGAEQPDETPKVFVARAFAESQTDIKDPAQATDEVLKALVSLAFDPSPGERSGGTGRIGKEYTEAASNIFALGPDKVKSAVKKLTKFNPGLVLPLLEDGTVTEAALASAIRTNAERVKKEQESLLIG